jgi:hypothetical protein
LTLPPEAALVANERSALARALCLVALAVGCKAEPGVPLPGETGVTDSPGSDSVPIDSSIDSGVDSDHESSTGWDTATESVPDVIDTDTGSYPETAPDLSVVPVFDPAPGAFSGSVTVTLTTSTGEGSVEFCVADPSETCTFAPYAGPFRISSSSIVHARAIEDWGTGLSVARSYVALDDTVWEVSSNLPMLIFWTDGSGPASGGDVPMGFDLFEPEKGATSFTAPATMDGRARLKLRGSSTYGEPKPSYDLEIWQPESSEDRDLALLDMPEDADWVLYAPYYYDDALIRNSLAYELSNEIGRYAPRTRFAEVYVADAGDDVIQHDYLGVYVVTEEIERGSDRVDVEKIKPEDVKEPEVTGGYIFKRDRLGSGESGFYAGTAGGEFYFDCPLVWVDPEESDIVPAQQAYLEDVIDAFARALVESDYTDPETGLHYSEIIDVDSWIDHHILNTLFKNPDAFRLSGYMFKDREGLLEAGPLWDFDRTAGAADSRATDPYYWDASNITSDTTPVFTWGWWDPLFDDPDFSDRYWARWEELLDDELSTDNMLDLVDDMVDDIGAAAAHNQARWHATDFDTDIDALKTWLEERHDWIADCIGEHADPRVCRG